MRDAPASLKLYRWLLRLYPPGFRESYAGPLEREFCDEMGECRNLRHSAALWLRLLCDLALSIPVQLTREALQDLRFALRLWARRPWHTAFAIAALAIGIGANTGVFSVVNGLLLRALPFQDPDHLAVVHDFLPPHDTATAFHQWRQQSTYLQDAALFEEFDVNLGERGRASRVHIAQTSWNFFSVLGSPPILGRGFLPGDDVNGTGWGLPGPNAVAVISYGLWQELFGGDRNVLGARLQIDGVPLTVVGVAPPGFDYPGKAAIWEPAAFAPANNGWEIVARLKPGISWQQAQSALQVEAERLSPKAGGSDSLKLRPHITSLRDGLAGPVRKASLAFLAAVIFVLLIACTNVANLLIARTVERTSELSIRSALGASRARLTRQMFTECFLLCFIATLAGLVVAYWTSSLAAKLQPPPLGTQSYSVLDVRVLGFTIVICGLTTLLCGILPTRHMGRALSAGMRGSGRLPGRRLSGEILVSAQVMFTIAFLAASVSVGQAFLKLMKIDRGYGVTGLITVNVSLDGTTHQIDKHQLPYFEDVLQRLRSLPWVRSASATEFLPLYASGFIGGPFGMDGHPARSNTGLVPVMSDYFQTIGGQILYGREFTDAEVRSGAKVAVVNERFAAGYGDPKDAVGHQLTIGNAPPWRIVGVVKKIKYSSDSSSEDLNQVFIPSTTPGGFFSTFVARVDGQAEDRLAAFRDTIQAVDSQVPLFGVKTMEQRLDEALAGPRFYRTALWFLAGFALLLAVIGIYGIVSHDVVQRTRDMGVRLALGTTPYHLRGMLLKRVLLKILAGAIPGIAGAQLTGRLLEAVVEGAKPVNVLTSINLLLFLAIVASLSIWSATRRVSRLEIMTILRSE